MNKDYHDSSQDRDHINSSLNIGNDGSSLDKDHNDSSLNRDNEDSSMNKEHHDSSQDRDHNDSSLNKDNDDSSMNKDYHESSLDEDHQDLSVDKTGHCHIRLDRLESPYIKDAFSKKTFICLNVAVEVSCFFIMTC